MNDLAGKTALVTGGFEPAARKDYAMALAIVRRKTAAKE